jgi:transposase-like protein
VTIAFVVKPDYPKTMREYRERFASRKACLEYLVKARWPEGFVCPHCQHAGGWLKEDRFLYRCEQCKRDTSPTAGTAMHRSKIPIQDWFWAAYMVATHTPGLSAKQLQRYLGTSSYETAWYLLQRFRRAMVNDNRSLLNGTVEADETLVGGPAKGKKGRGVAKGKNKSLVLGMVEVLSYKDASGKAKKRAGRVRLEVADHADEETIRAFLDKNLKPGSKVQTDGWRGYSETALLDYRHVIKVQDSPQSASRLAPHIHRVFSNLKAWLMGTHHGVEPKYLQAYLDEFVFRFNRRQTPMAAFQTLLGITAVKTPATMRKIQSGYSTG